MAPTNIPKYNVYAHQLLYQGGKTFTVSNDAGVFHAPFIFFVFTLKT